MALEDDIRILAAVSLFHGFSEEQLRLLAFGAETIRLTAGRELFREGATADCAFVVVRGSVSLYRERGGVRQIIATAKPPDLLGEYALITDVKRMTGARIEVDSEVMRLSRKLFRRILEEYPEAAVTLHDRIAHDLTEMLGRIGQLAPRFQ